jgi:hypothetical protein
MSGDRDAGPMVQTILVFFRGRPMTILLVGCWSGGAYCRSPVSSHSVDFHY